MRIKDSRLYAQVVIRTIKVIILRCFCAEEGTDLFINECRTCSTLIFPHSTNQILNFWRCLSLPFPSSMRKLPIGLRETFFVPTRDVRYRLAFFMLAGDAPVSKKYKVLQAISLSGQKSLAIFQKMNKVKYFHTTTRGKALKNIFSC